MPASIQTSLLDDKIVDMKFITVLTDSLCHPDDTSSHSQLFYHM